MLFYDKNNFQQRKLTLTGNKLTGAAGLADIQI